MTNIRVLAAFTALNLALVVLTLTLQWSAAAAEVPPSVLRGRGLEIVDDQGRVRASISVLPQSRSANGEASAETVLFRLITELGRPSIKIGASEPVAGLSIAGPTGTENTYVVLEARGTTSSLVLRKEDGKERLVTP
jgi:hypothetical protein